MEINVVGPCGFVAEVRGDLWSVDNTMVPTGASMAMNTPIQRVSLSFHEYVLVDRLYDSLYGAQSLSLPWQRRLVRQQQKCAATNDV
jgi:hypothetical protein